MKGLILTAALAATTLAQKPAGGAASTAGCPKGWPKGPYTPPGSYGNRGPSTENELTEKPCKDIIFIMARASSEPGNMGGSMGPLVCAGLRKAYTAEKVACQGVGGAYKAGMGDNGAAKGTTDAAIAEATTLFTTASTKCPKSIVTFGGYSQGSAVMHGAVSTLPDTIKSQIVAGVTFGDTRYLKNNKQIPNYPKDQVEIFCPEEDTICKGGGPFGAHMKYADCGFEPSATAFLKGKIDAKLGKTS